MSPSILLALVCVALAFVPADVMSHLAWNRTAIAHGEIWRLWTGHLVHYSMQHAMFDASMLALTGWSAERYLGRRRVRAALAIGATVMSMTLFAFRDVDHYRGASALALFLGTLAAAAMWRSNAGVRPALVAAACLFVAKCVSDAMGTPLTLVALPDRVRVAWPLHLVATALAIATMRRFERRRRQDAK